MISLLMQNDVASEDSAIPGSAAEPCTFCDTFEVGPSKNLMSERLPCVCDRRMLHDHLSATRVILLYQRSDCVAGAMRPTCGHEHEGHPGGGRQ